MKIKPKQKLSTQQIYDQAAALAATQPQKSMQLCGDVVVAERYAGMLAEQAAVLRVKLVADSPQYLNDLGLCLLANNKLDTAKNAFEFALKLKPDYPEALANYGRLLQKMGQISQGRELYDLAVRICDDNKALQQRIRINRLNVILDQGLFDEALDEALQVLEQRPNDVVLLGVTGRILHETDRHSEALKYYERAFKLDPQNIDIQVNLALCYGASSLTDKHLPFMQQTLKKIESLYNYGGFGNHFSKIRNFVQLHKGLALPQGSFIVEAANLDAEKYDTINYKFEPIDDYRGLYHFSDIKSFEGEWTLYNQQKIYMNLMVVGRPETSTRGESFEGKVIMKNHDITPQLILDTPHILLGGAENYYHWMIDFLPRVGVLDDLPHLSQLPVIVNNDYRPYQQKALELVGFDTNRLIKAPHNHVLVCKDLYVPHLYGRPMTEHHSPDWMKPMINDWVVQWIRQKFAPLMQKRHDLPKRIFISRAGARFRKCFNEAGVYAIAQKHGFVMVENEKLSFEEQIALYANAEVVMGPHGAGFTNMVFAPQNAMLIEMMPKNRCPTFFMRLCEQIGQQHHYFDGPLAERIADFGKDFWNFEVNLEEVADKLQQWLP